MTDASQYAQIETLKNGSATRIRAVRADDKDRFVRAFRNLEAESVYTRFFHAKKALSADELRAATEVDFDSVVALVATIGEDEDETIVGAGRYVAFDGADGLRSAEVAFTVEEDYHGQGIAGRLLRHLAGIARAKGVARFEAEVLPGNLAMMAVFEKSGLPVDKKHQDGTLHVTLSLARATA